MKSLNLNTTSVEVKSEKKSHRSSYVYDIINDLNNSNGFYGISDDVEQKLLIAIRREMRQKMIKNIFTN